MIVKLTINPNTLETVLEDHDARVNEIKILDDGQIFIEVSKPDPEFTTPTGQ